MVNIFINMSTQELEKSIFKLINTLVVKDRIDFAVEVFEYINDTSEKNYQVYVTFTNDHSKYWPSSPSYSQDYNEMISNLENNIEDEVYSLVQYVITDEVVVRIVWEHSNTEVYEPLFDMLGEMKVHFAVNFNTYVPNLALKVDERYSPKISEIFSKLSEKFDTDYIAIWNENLN